MYFSEEHVGLWTNLSSIKSFKEKKVQKMEHFFCRGGRARKKKTHLVFLFLFLSSFFSLPHPIPTLPSARHRLRLLQLRRPLGPRRHRR